MSDQNVIDVKENDLLKIDKSLLNILLKDRTTDRNIIWATDNYIKYGPEYFPNQPITIDLITGYKGNVIRPRVAKSKIEQQWRIRQKAEVFTPSWICNRQNNLIDEAWFGKKNIFNKETNHGWATNYKRITFPKILKKSWQDYISTTRMEISCGEAPYITSRYDSVNGSFIEVKDRIGILDRKLRIISENTETEEEWIKWAYIAVQNVYGFDWQGDNILLARENLLYDIAEYYNSKFSKKILPQDMVGFAEIISWNIWQMDGLKFVIPNSCCTKNIVEEDLFGSTIKAEECKGCKNGDYLKHNGIYCSIKDWNLHRNIRYVDLITGEKNGNI